MDKMNCKTCAAEQQFGVIVAVCGWCGKQGCAKHVQTNRGVSRCLPCSETFSPTRAVRASLFGPETAALQKMKELSYNIEALHGWLVDWDYYSETTWKSTVNRVVGEHGLCAEYDGRKCKLIIESIVCNSGKYSVIINGEFVYVVDSRVSKHVFSVPFNVEVTDDNKIRFVSRHFHDDPIVMHFE
jgi:hypothetical protein